VAAVPGGWWTLGAIGAVVVVVVILLASGGSPRGGKPRAYGDAVADPIPYDGRSPAPPTGRTERVLVELPRPALGAMPDLATAEAKQQRAYVRSLKQESTALLGALRARGVKLRDVVTFERTWHGFAATVKAGQLTRLQSLGVRLRTNRRLFPAFSEPIRTGDGTMPKAPQGAPRVTLLAGGVPGADGYDAVDHDHAPVSEGDVGGTPLAGTLAQLGVQARVIRVTALTGGEEAGRTDELLDGLEHTVDPDGNGDTTDHDRVALIGVNAPFAGFADAPEVQAAAAARALGTLVVAPAGEEGQTTGAYGTIGAPAASTGALAVVPESDQGALARTTLKIGNTTVGGAAILAGRPFTDTIPTAGPLTATTARALLAKGQPSLAGHLAVIRAGANPGAQVAAAATAGAGAVLLAEPRDGHVLPAVSAGRVTVPVLGVTGPAATAILALGAEQPATATGLQPPAPLTTAPLGTGPVSRFASTGPAYDGTNKPDLERPGSVLVGGELVSGAAIAAARVAAEAAQQTGTTEETITALLAPTQAARDSAAQERGPLQPPPVPVSGLKVDLSGGTAAVTFTAGSFDRGDPTGGIGATIVPAARLDLTLETSTGRGRVTRLTPPGGALDVLPGEYAYTIPKPVFRRLPKGAYAFTVRAKSPGQAEPTLQTSPVFQKK
jgi:hypothetical protein